MLIQVQAYVGRGLGDVATDLHKVKRFIYFTILPVSSFAVLWLTYQWWGLMWLSAIIGFLVGIKAFTAAVLGGIGSLPGAMLGGLLIGLIETFWSGYFTVEYKDVAAFAILVLVLIFRPTGLLGRPEVEKV